MFQVSSFSVKGGGVGGGRGTLRRMIFLFLLFYYIFCLFVPSVLVAAALKSCFLILFCLDSSVPGSLFFRPSAASSSDLFSSQRLFP